MSFLSALGSIVGFLPIPGANYIEKGLNAAGSVGSVLGKQQQGKAAGKVSQAELNQRQDALALQKYQAEQGAQNTAAQTDLQRKGFETNNRSSTAKQALIGALLGGGVTPTSISGGQASGGLLRSLNGNPDALAALKTLGSQGSAAQNTPLQFQGGAMLQAPTLTPVPQVDQGGIGSTLAQALQLIGSFGGANVKPPKPPQDDSQYSLPGGQY